MPAAEVVYKLSKEALRMVQNGSAEWTAGGIRNVKTKRIMALARPIMTTTLSNKQMLQSIAGSMKTVSALSWVNAAMSLVNVGVSVVGFYLMLKEMQSIHGEIHQFIARYKADKEADHLEKYKLHLKNMTTQLNFLQNRYEHPEYDRKEFMNRESDIETECNETASFLERIIEQYLKKEIPSKLACQIIFTLSPVYVQLVNEYCCQFYCEHNSGNNQLETWKGVLDKINSESFRMFMKKEMAFDILYADVSPQKRADAIKVAFECIQELQNHIVESAEAIKTAPEGSLIPVSVLLDAKAWDEVKDHIRTEQGESPEEYIQHQLMQMAINDDGEEEVYVPLQMQYA